MVDPTQISHNSGTPLYRQVAERFITLIESGELKKNDVLPSVNALQAKTGISRVSILNAYDYLRKNGIIEARHGKGFYVARESGLRTKSIFLLFDAMNSYKEILYKSFIESLGIGFMVDIFFHYYNLKQFNRFIRNNLGDYSHYVVLPHFNVDISKILCVIPPEKLILLDGDVPGMPEYPAVYQDFKNDVINAVTEARTLLMKYDTFSLVTGSNFQFIPQGIMDGFVFSCKELGIEYKIIKEIKSGEIKTGEAFLVFTDNDLIRIVQHTKSKNLKLGKDIGLVSYDDTPLKSVLADGITTISTDFVNMGATAAKMIKGGMTGKHKNPSRIIIRNSL